MTNISFTLRKFNFLGLTWLLSLLAICFGATSKAIAVNAFGSATPIGFYAANSSNKLYYWPTPAGYASSNTPFTNAHELYQFWNIDFTPDGTLYGTENSNEGTLYKGDPVTGALVPIGDTHSYSFAIDPSGNAIGIVTGHFVRINLTDGSTTILGPTPSSLQAEARDLAFNREGKIFATVDSSLNKVVEVDPLTGLILNTINISGFSTVFPHNNFLSGIAFDSGDQMYVTAFNVNFGNTPDLYSVNQQTGVAHLLGHGLTDTIYNEYSWGLAFIPEPATLLLIGLAFPMLLQRRDLKAGR